VASFVGWLDYSEAERRQVQEMLQLFTEKGTVDDLGVGTVRDVISNRLFPGTSVIQTRARYFLFVPWIFMRAESKYRGQVLERAEAMERRLVEALKNADDQEGLIGRQAGKDVKTLPSAIYWTGLAAYGIFQQGPLSRAQYSKAVRSTAPRAETADELADRPAAFWRPGIPAPPDGFFDLTAADFDLTREEAEWLSERVLSASTHRGPNLLHDLVAQLRTSPEVPTEMFWDILLPDSTEQSTREMVHHAERFSTAVHGASLLYNLMLAEEREDLGREDDKYAEQMEHLLEVWADDVQRTGTDDWAGDLTPFWSLLTSRSRVPARTRSFVDSWCTLLTTAPVRNLASNSEARALVRQREFQHKGPQARFESPSRLRSWNHDTGTAPLSFRWGQVQRFLTDLSAGLLGRPDQHSEVSGAAN
jgi:hypothetical protein